MSQLGIEQPRYTTIEISKEDMHFAAAHFTIFSATERENLHGHNFYMALDATALVGDNGITFDYNVLKKAARQLCDDLDEQVLMPSLSPYLEIEEGSDYTYALYNGERIPFLVRDLTVLPVRNITVEEMAHYFLNELLDTEEIKALDLVSLNLKCASGDGQWASSGWQKNQEVPA